MDRFDQDDSAYRRRILLTPPPNPDSWVEVKARIMRVTAKAMRLAIDVSSDPRSVGPRRLWFPRTCVWLGTDEILDENHPLLEGDEPRALWVDRRMATEKLTSHPATDDEPPRPKEVRAGRVPKSHPGGLSSPGSPLSPLPALHMGRICAGCGKPFAPDPPWEPSDKCVPCRIAPGRIRYATTEDDPPPATPEDDDIPF